MVDNDVKHGLFPTVFFVVVADVVVGAALAAVPVPLFPDDRGGLLVLPVPPPESPDPEVDDDGELLLFGDEEDDIPLLVEDDVWLPLRLLCAAYTLVVAVNPLAVMNVTIVMKQTARRKFILS